MVKLYRAVSQAEYENWEDTHTFEATAGSLEGKWFALHREHAVLWGQWFSAKSGVKHDRIIAVEVPDELYEKFEPKLQTLDGIGPACFAPMSLLRGVVFQEVLE
jgi:hypothetical protein